MLRFRTKFQSEMHSINLISYVFLSTVVDCFIFYITYNSASPVKYFSLCLVFQDVKYVTVKASISTEAVAKK